MTISPLPMLIDADDAEDADGEVVLFYSGRRSLTKVRAIGPGEIKARARSGKVFSPKDPETPLYDALRAMQANFELDMAAFQDALKDARRYLAFPMGPGFRVSDWDGARWIYSSLLTNAVQSVRHLVWFPYEFDSWASAGAENDRLVCPALYCGSEKTAAFLMLFMDYVRVCQLPNCLRLYVPKTYTQKCCCPNHSNNLRVRRFNKEHKRGKKKAIGAKR